MADLGLGTDFATPPDATGALDFTASFATSTGRVQLLQSLARRFTTAPGSMFWAPGEGLDVREWLEQSFTPAERARLPAQLVAQAMRDDRVLAARATVNFNVAASSLQIALELEDADGPFPLVFDVTAVSLAIVNGGV